MSGWRTPVWVAGALAVCGALLWYAFSSPEKPVAKPKTVEERPVRAERKPALRRSATNRVARVPARTAPRKSASLDPGERFFSNMSEKDRKTAVGIQTALDAEDLAGVRAFCAEAQASKDPELRRHMVEALGWFGTKAMADVSKFLNDGDKDVRTAAASAWDGIVSNVEEDPVRIALVRDVFRTVRDEDTLDMLASHLNGTDEKLSVEAICELLHSNDLPSAAKRKAMETYEFITGEEFSGSEAARQWLEKNYTPPEKED